MTYEGQLSVIKGFSVLAGHPCFGDAGIFTKENLHGTSVARNTHHECKGFSQWKIHVGLSDPESLLKYGSIWIASYRRMHTWSFQICYQNQPFIKQGRDPKVEKNP